MTIIRIQLAGGGRELFTPADGVVPILVNGVPILGIDLAYLDPDEEDPALGQTWGGTATGPHLVVGYWEDDDDGTWVRILEVPAPTPGDLTCDECGEPMFITDASIAHHGEPGAIVHDVDADHVAYNQEQLA